MGGFLAKPNTQHLNNWLKSKLMEKNPNQAAWFGLNKMSNGWCHIDGSLVSRGYTDWAPGRRISYLSLVVYRNRNKNLIIVNLNQIAFQNSLRYGRDYLDPDPTL